MKCQNPECSKEIPEGKKYCNQNCLKRHLEIKKKRKSNGALNTAGSDLTAQLMDSCFQRGLSWRGAKIEAIQTAFAKGYSEEWVLKNLMRGGMTRMTAQRLITDCRFVYGDETELPLEITEDQLKEELEEENEQRRKLGKPKVTLEEWKQMRTKRTKPI